MGYLVAVLTTGMALLIRLSLAPGLFVSATFMPFFMAILGTAWFGGLRPGLLATALCAVAGAYFLLPPEYDLRIESGSHRLQLALFCGTAVGISLVCESLHVARRRAERQRESLRVTVASIGDAVVTTDGEGRVTSLNPVAVSLTGWASKDAKGRPLEEVFSIVNEDTRRPVENPVKKVLAEGNVVGLASHTVLIARDGTERSIDDSAAPIRDVNGGTVGVVLVFRDVTEQRRSEREKEEAQERVARTLESVSDGFFAFDREWKFTYVNGAAKRLLDVTPGDLIGKDFWESFPGLAGSEFERAYRRTMSEGVAQATVGYYPDHARWYEANSYPSPTGITIFFRDATERVRSEAAVRESEERYRVLFESAPMAVFACDLNAVIQHYNAHAVELWGREPACGVERHCGSTKLWLPDGSFLPHHQSPMVEVLRTGVPARDVEVFIERPDGSRLPVLVNFAPLKNARGEVTGAVTSFIDITGRKRAEEVVRRAEERLRFILDSMPQKVFTAKPNGDVDYFNPIWTEFTGLSLEQIIDWGWTRFIHPDDVAENVRVWKHSVETGEPFHFEHRFRRHDGEYCWHVSRALPMRNEDGRVAMWIGSNTDIHDIKRAEQTARFVAGVGAALADLNDPVSTLQKVASMSVPTFADWCVVDVADEDGNHRRVAVTHADPAKLRAYRALMERYPPCTDDEHGIPHVLRTGQPVLVEDITDAMLAAVAHDEEHLRLLRGMGLKSHVIIPIRSHRRTHGVLTFITAESGRQYTPADLRVAQDVAHRAAVSIQNADLHQALREADRRKDEFLATLAHELRNPLAPIRNALQIVRLSGDREATEKARAMMERQVEQMVRLVDDLMDVSRISRGKLELKTERVQLAAVVSSAVETSRPLIDQMGHELTVTLPESPVVIDADLTRLAQVFLNLLNNAAKYSERGGRIRLTAERQGGDVVVSVRDTGIGIAADQLPHIFDMFSQVDHSLEKSQGGLGIGLTLVKRLVEMHGGGIEARSDGPGKGSEFVMRLPVVVEASVPQAAGRDDGPAPKSALRVMIVDDNRDGADSLSDMLRLMGNDTRTAYDGEEAVAAAGEFRPDVVLLDIGLPKLNGYDACRRIREQPWGKGVVLIALTGWGQADDVRRSQEAGFDRHIVKPVDPTALMGLLAGLQTAKP